MATSPATVPVIAAVIRRDGCYLLCRRPAHKRHGGLWEFPGGKLERGESWIGAVRRELREELGLEVRGAAAPLFECRDAGSRFGIRFVPVDAVGDPRPFEHDEVRWVALRDLADMDLAPADRAFARHLLSAVEPRGS